MLTTDAINLVSVGVSETKAEGTNEFGYLWIELRLCPFLVTRLVH
jgi:hypothetical protein